MWFPLLLLGAGAATLITLALASYDGPVPDHKPDAPPTPGKTGYRLVDAIMPQLQKAASDSGLPLGLLVSWIAVESGGKLAEAPKPLKGERDSERGLFQLTPSESDRLNLDHAKLSTDLNYSILGGLLAIKQLYMPAASAFGLAAPGSTYENLLTKLIHTVGAGGAKKYVDAAKAAGAVSSWDDFEDYCLAHDAELLSSSHHSPRKWFGLLDKMAKIGEPFGMGTGSMASTAIVGGLAEFADIVDPLDALRA